MSFKLSDVDLEADFEELMAVMWAAHEEPVQPFFRLFCPIVNGDRQASLKESTERMLEWDRHDPQARWLKVQDVSTGRIAGAAWYKIYKEDPFAHPEEEAVEWYPDDTSRDFVSQAIRQMDRPREEKATRPQVFLNILFTHPGYRRKGIGAMLVQWGIDAAKELGVEFWLNATPVGKPLYEKLGFEVVERNPLVPKTERPDATWNATAREFSDIVFWTMWLPKVGTFETNKTKRPWET
ncbi:acyl-CoA N-acyltransferase [Paraphaeosphaeria sporulosa]|uniref:Acyl-CoA N-acyltransferase n=1 Tax=Paraphaeosphaeria sporulosa TaxID=1460663 RepID=A0A177C7I8_9PLEO|nr:acyl-CoA N-acyltransferase [Paraphaeosphaeria sporulosa]OAG02717.1 acyl-CoA N-acyltransferase [Paraphaeosphaeria sporulosa]